MTDEGEIWYFTTERLNRGQFRVIGGEPPGGSSKYPRIEARHPDNTRKGSAGSMKHDIYILYDGRILLCEAKDHPHKTTDDVDRLNDAVDSTLWAGALWDAMDQRGLINKWVLPQRSEFIAERHDILRKALVIPQGNDFQPPKDFVLIETDEDQTTVYAGDDFPDDDMLDALEGHVEEYGRMTSFR